MVLDMLTFVILTQSVHIGAPANAFNNQNYGIGVEYTDELTYGVYLYHNSYKDTSLMLSISKQWKYGGFGFAVANGYSKDSKAIAQEYLIGPEVTFNVTKHIRVKTSFPFGTLANSYDVANLQFTISF